MTPQSPTPGQALTEADVTYEVWQGGDFCAFSDSLSEAEHYAAVYGQDGPVERQTVISYRRAGFLPPGEAAPASDVAGGAERKAVARVERYLSRLSKARQYDQEDIHGFDVGEPSEAILRVSDLRTILALLRPAAPDAPGGGERLAALEAVARLADELVNGGGLVNRGIDRGLVVVEKPDRSDPHYRLCDALETLSAIPAQPSEGGA